MKQSGGRWPGGRVFGASGRDWPALDLYEGGIHIRSYGELPERRTESSKLTLISEKSLLVRDGNNVAVSDGRIYPRTAVGINERGKYLWLVVVDGKQPRHSTGMDLQALARLMVEMGVRDAIELDGGGSSTMAARFGSDIKLLNRPSHTNQPAWERPVANHLIVY